MWNHQLWLQSNGAERPPPAFSSLRAPNFIASDIFCNENILFFLNPIVPRFPTTQTPIYRLKLKPSVHFERRNSHCRKSQWDPGKWTIGSALYFAHKNTVLKCLFNPGLGKRERQRQKEAHIHTHSAPNWTHLQYKYLLPCVGMAKLWSFPSLQYGAHTRTRTHLHVDTNDHTCIWDRKGLHNKAHFE